MQKWCRDINNRVDELLQRRQPTTENLRGFGPTNPQLEIISRYHLVGTTNIARVQGRFPIAFKEEPAPSAIFKEGHTLSIQGND